MQKEIFCGNSCIKYIFNEYKIIDNSIFEQNMNWIAELALVLLKNNISIEVLCYNSDLFNDYKKIGKDNMDFLGFKSIYDLEKNKVFIKEKKLSIRQLISELNESECIILCVKSSLFNNDKSMIGGHYIILNKLDEEYANVINPIKKDYQYKKMKLKDIINCCNIFGSWRILIKENKND